jgi:excisionase family DNA binding protein
MTVEVITLERSELERIIDRAAKHAVMELRNDLHKPTPEIMTKAELAEYLRCDVSKVNRFMSKGMPFTRFGTNPRFYKSEIDTWLKNERVSEVQGQAGRAEG